MGSLLVNLFGFGSSSVLVGGRFQGGFQKQAVKPCRPGNFDTPRLVYHGPHPADLVHQPHLSPSGGLDRMDYFQNHERLKIPAGGETVSMNPMPAITGALMRGAKLTGSK